MTKPVADLWYGVAACEGDIIHIRETHIDQWAAGNIWLVPGSKRDLIFDTGTGMVSPAQLVSILSSKPKIAIACCHYYDHAGGMYAFENRACHHLEVDEITEPQGGSEPLYQEELYAFPYKGFQVSNYAHRGAAPTQILKDGDTIDLGNRTLEVLHIPGRTPGSIALWEAATGYLFGGETAFIDPFNHDFPPEQSVALYEESLQRLAELPVKRVFGGHYGIFGSEQLAKLVDQETGRYR